MSNRRDFLGGLAGASVAAGAVVAAVASPDPDAEVMAAARAVLDLRAEQDRAVDDYFAAEARAGAAYPPRLPAWKDWAEVNHPRGPFLKPGATDTAGRAVLVGLLRGLPSRADGQIDVSEVDWLCRDGEMIADGMVKAEAEYYAEIRPSYDALVAEREAAAARIDQSEGLPVLDMAIDRIEQRHAETLAALLAMQPATASGFVHKAAAIMFHADPDKIMQTLESDARALIAGGVA